MRRGPWHQCGDRSQKLVKEQLQSGVGVGVVLSSRDLSHHKAVEYSADYHALVSNVMIDCQFYVPDFSNRYLATYPINQFRTTISQLHQITNQDLGRFAQMLEDINLAVGANAIIAPAVVYEAGRPEILQLNGRLFSAAKQVGNNLGVPTYATVVLGRSVTMADQTTSSVLSNVTSLDADGWHFAYEFGEERLPSLRSEVYRFCAAGLTLACTGKPVMHAYAGPMALLSFGFGANAVGIGHSQNLWQLTRARWEPSAGEGGGGGAPARFFSTSLWGTIIHPDETALLPANLRMQVLTHSPFSSSGSWNRWTANKHLVNSICGVIGTLAGNTDSRQNASVAISRLATAVALHRQISGQSITLADSANVYQENWRAAMADLLANHSTDYDYLDLLMAP